MTKRGLLGVVLFLTSGICQAQNFPAQRYNFTDTKTFAENFKTQDLEESSEPSVSTSNNVTIENNLVSLHLKPKDTSAEGAEIFYKKEFKEGLFEFQMRPSCSSESQTSFRLHAANTVVFQYSLKGSSQRSLFVQNENAETSKNLDFNACERMHSYAIHIQSNKLIVLVDNRLLAEETLPSAASYKISLQISAPSQKVSAATQTQIKSFLIASTRVEQILEKLSLDEKLHLLGGHGDGFTTPALPQYAIPSLTMTDGPVGIRFGDNTAFPASIALAATFNREMALLESQQIAREALANGKRILLGPCVNMARIPLGGRAFESFGEDPFLSAELAKHYVTGMQSQGVMTSVKHFLLNEQEYNRMSADVQIDEKVLQELYLPPFEAAIEVGATTVMAAYNKVRGSYSSENSYLLTDLLKKDLGFKGIVISDWGATHSSAASALAGLDIEMPYRNMFGAPLKEDVLNGTVPVSVIDEKVRRVLYSMEELNLFEASTPAELKREDSTKIARQVANESFVLLKNEKNILPLNPQKKLKVAVIGPSVHMARTGGGGSSHVFTTRTPSTFEALQAQLQALQSPIELSFAQGARLEADKPFLNPSLFSYSENGAQISGFKAFYYKNADLEGEPSFVRTDATPQFDWSWSSPDYKYLPEDYFSVRWTTQFHPKHSGPHEFIMVHDDGVRLFVNDELVVDSWTNESDQGGLRTSRYVISAQAGETYNLKLEYVERDTLATLYLGLREPVNGHLPNDQEQAVELAQKSDVVLIFAGLNKYVESEGFDRKDFHLPKEQTDLITAVSKANPQTAVILQVGSPVDLSWATHVPALLQAWYPGEQGAFALAETLLGLSNPSGKLPVTFPKSLEDVPAMKGYPGDNKIVIYSEGMHLGYRGIRNYFYPFGFGLSYSKFALSNVQITATNATTQDTEVNITADIRNTGDRDGAEVVQVYIQHPETQDYINLKEFQKIWIPSQQSKSVKFVLSQKAFEQYDSELQRRVVYTGQYKILVKIGSELTSTEIPLTVRPVSTL